jgi:hypothetical protein
MSKKLELLKEKEALECRLREVDRLLAAERATGHDRDAVQAIFDDLARLREEEPYDPAEWEQLERNLGIYEEIHGPSPA